MDQSFITLLSDLGTKDPAVAAVKTAVTACVPGSHIVDISHGVRQYDLRQAAYFLLSACDHFPVGTIHLCLTDVFAGEAPHMVLAMRNGHYFLAPDNGMLPLAFGNNFTDVCSCYESAAPHTFRLWVDKCCEIIKAVHSANGKALSLAGCEIKEATSLLQPRAMQNALECNVLHIDRYGNIVLDITHTQFEQVCRNRAFRIMLHKTEDITTISHNYNDVAAGKPLCRFNSAGFMELALNHGMAATLPGFADGGISYPVVHIDFM